MTRKEFEERLKNARAKSRELKASVGGGVKRV
jgi:hypothetical protein